MENTVQAKVNFFKPITEHARANRRLILTLAIIWAIAVFGFQVLLILVNKPAAEEKFVQFEQLWPGFVAGTSADDAVKQDLAKISLAVLGKNIALQPADKTVLQLAVSKLIVQLLPEEQKSLFAQAPLEYLAANDLHGVLGLETGGFDKLYYDLLPTSLVPVDDGSFTPQMVENIPAVMQLYLVHNRSFLTDARILGFPFHYWYTAQFLLILFVVLCIIYASAIDKLHKKHGIEQ